MLKLASILASSALVAGCTFAPHYERPAAPVSESWPGGNNSPTATMVGATPAAPEVGWRDFFGDPRLQSLIALALENNRDLRVALLNVERSQALYRIQRADSLPGLSATGSGARQQAAREFTPAGQSRTQSQYSVTADVTAFEVDLWGRVRSLNREALETYLATEEAGRSVRLSLVGEVATQYLGERAANEQLALARQTLEAVKASLDLAQQRFKSGAASELDLRTAESQFQTARANVAVYVQQQAQALNALVLLVGRTLPADLPAPRALGSQVLIAALPPGLPSTLLQQRPDVLAAEHTLRAANASIGAARAAFFPSIALTAFGGTSSSELSGLFESSSSTWLFSPQINLPIFTGGRNRANLDAAKIGKRIEIANYEKAIQTAFREVADPLAAQPALDEQIDALTTRVSSEQRRYELSDRRYRAGADTYLTVLLAQQDLYSAQQTLIQSQLSRLTNAIALYKALGGGGLESSASPTPRSS